MFVVIGVLVVVGLRGETMDMTGWRTTTGTKDI